VPHYKPTAIMQRSSTMISHTHFRESTVWNASRDFITHGYVNKIYFSFI